MLRILKNLPSRSDLDNLPGIHHSHSIGHFGHYTQIMGDHDHCSASFSLQIAHQIQHLRLDCDIKRSGWFIGKQKGRIIGQRHSDHHPLSHPT